MRSIILIVHNVRSCHNVGALLRTADGLGVEKVYLTGYTPYPLTADDERLPHIADKLNRRIVKTSLGAERSVAWSHNLDIRATIKQLREEGFTVVALEQAPGAARLDKFKPPNKVALIVGREVGGIEPEALAWCDQTVAIPMLGRKESFNVAAAAAIALYHCRFTN